MHRQDKHPIKETVSRLSTFYRAIQLLQHLTTDTDKAGLEWHITQQLSNRLAFLWKHLQLGLTDYRFSFLLKNDAR